MQEYILNHLFYFHTFDYFLNNLKVSTEKCINDLSIVHDEQLEQLESTIKNFEIKISEKDKKIRQLVNDSEAANVYMMGDDTKNKNPRMCPVFGCDGKGNIKNGSTHYTYLKFNLSQIT